MHVSTNRLTRRALGLPAITAVGVGLLTAAPADADVVFQFNYLDASGVGFNAAGSTGADRRAGLEQAAAYVSSILGPSYNAIIDIDVVGSVTADTTLASASSQFTSAFPGNGFGSAGDIQLQILGGDAADPSPGTVDGNIFWNFEDFNWEPLSDFQPGELDLISTAIHEITHAIGFASDITQAGNSGWGDSAGTPTAWSPFDEFVADSSGALIDGSFALDGARWNAASVGGTGPSDGLFFIGANAMAANGGNPVALYSPTTWLAGSSGSHLDTDLYDGTGGTIENMMNHESTVFEGLDLREYTAIELGILRDIGYTNIVPEPGSIALLGLGGLALLRRRR